MKVLIATEGSDFSKAAIDECRKLFGGSDQVTVRVLAAVEPTVPATEPFAVSAEYINQLDAAARAHAEEVVSQAESEIRDRCPSWAAGLTGSVVMGSPAQVIVEEAENWGAELIVVGSHGYGFWKRALLGSVSNAVAHHAPCSVLIARKPGESSSQ